MSEKITVSTSVNAAPDKVWEFWTTPEHIEKWNNASEDWHTPHAEVDLKPGGKFLSRMEAKDGSFGFDFTGTYEEIEKEQRITYSMEDGRYVEIIFIKKSDSETEVVETFDTENENSPELQRQGWQAILNNFKAYTEAN